MDVNVLENLLIGMSFLADPTKPAKSRLSGRLYSDRTLRSMVRSSSKCEKLGGKSVPIQLEPPRSFVGLLSTNALIFFSQLEDESLSKKFSSSLRFVATGCLLYVPLYSIACVLVIPYGCLYWPLWTWRFLRVLAKDKNVKRLDGLSDEAYFDEICGSHVNKLEASEDTMETSRERNMDLKTIYIVKTSINNYCADMQLCTIFVGWLVYAPFVVVFMTVPLDTGMLNAFVQLTVMCVAVLSVMYGISYIQERNGGKEMRSTVHDTEKLYWLSPKNGWKVIGNYVQIATILLLFVQV